MFETDDNYNLYYDGVVTEGQVTEFKELVKEYEISGEFLALLKRQYDFGISNTYNNHKKLIWVLYKTLGSFAITIFFAEHEHPPACEYQAKADFYVEANGNFEYELQNQIFMYDNVESSAECEERIARGSIGFDKDLKIKGNIQGMDLTDFTTSITARE